MATSATGSGTVGLLELTQSIQPGIVTQAMLTVNDPTLGPSALWASITIINAGDDEFTPLYVLVSGFFSINEPLVWNGFLSIDSNAQIQANIVGQRDGQIFLNYRRLTQNNIAEVGKYLEKILSAKLDS